MSAQRPEEFHFLDPQVQRCPYEFYRALREHAPVYREPQTGYYIVSRYEDILAVKRNTRVYSNDVAKHALRGRPPQAALEIYRSGFRRPITLQRTDPPAHTRYRKLIGKTFTISRVNAMTPYIQSVIDELIEGFPASGEIDFVSEFGVRLPCYIIADQLGVPREDALKLKLWSDGLLDPAGLMITPEREVECARLTVEFQRYFAAQIEERRREPRDDILSDLCSRIDGEDPFTVEEVLNMIEQIMTGGNESTTGLLGSSMLLLIRHPQQQNMLRTKPALIAGFVEEALRTETPVQSNFRRTLEEVELQGVRIPQGSIVVLRYGAANRDESRFERSEEFDVCRRDAGAHISFGAGIHHCPGAMLARKETLLAFTALLRRFERFELRAEESALEYHPTFFLRGLRSLPVRLVRASH